MTDKAEFDSWSAGKSYEHYMGRWSRKVAAEFLGWLAPPLGADWIKAGCGSGALTTAILSRCAPTSVLATDQSEDFAAFARQSVTDPRARFSTADAQALPVGDATVDVAVSALVLNFVPDKAQALREMQRVLRPGGLLSFYVWDYPGGGIGFIDAFWNAAAELDPSAAGLDERRRFPFCTQDGLSQIYEEAGIAGCTVEAIETTTEFEDFDAFWHPFTLGAGSGVLQGAAGGRADAPAGAAAQLRRRQRAGAASGPGMGCQGCHRLRNRSGGI